MSTFLEKTFILGPAMSTVMGNNAPRERPRDKKCRDVAAGFVSQKERRAGLLKLASDFPDSFIYRPNQTE